MIIDHFVLLFDINFYHSLNLHSSDSRSLEDDNLEAK